jgi:hypothetical protein
MKILSDLPLEQMTFEDLPKYHRMSIRYPNEYPKGPSSYIRFGEVKRGGNEPYCYTAEKQVAGHICRILARDLSMVLSKMNVVRDDGTVWIVNIDNFKDATWIELV